MVKMGNPIGGARHKSQRMKDAERVAKLERMMVELRKRVEELERSTSPHALAGRD